MFYAAQTTQPNQTSRHSGESRSPWVFSIDPVFQRDDEKEGPDRLSHAIYFANELNDSRLRKRAQNRWNGAKRAAQSSYIRQKQPWKRSTGPKSGGGKAVACLNAYKHGLRSRAGRRLHRALRAQSWFLRWAVAEHALKNTCSDDAVMLVKRMVTLTQILVKTRKAFEAAGFETAALDARLIARQGGNLSDSDLISLGEAPLSAQIIENIEKLAARRLVGEPVSRLAGGREFWGLDFKISPDTLDPRADTETLVQAALNWARSSGQTRHCEEPSGDAAIQSRPLQILDLGTGSGCILISLLRELPHATGVGIDINPGAVSISRENAVNLGVADRAEFRVGSWFGGLKDGESFDLIVSNPPYIPHHEIESLAPEVRNHDPIQALSPGETGLEAYKIILNDLKKSLVCGGRALFEIGQGQEKPLARLVDESNMYVCDSYPDLAGILRVVEISRGEK